MTAKRRRGLRATVPWLAGLVVALALCPADAARLVIPGATVERVSVPWQPGNASRFLEGTRVEGGRRADRGALPVTIVRPDGPGPFPFVVLLHGCGGIRLPVMWGKWVRPWAELFSAHGIGSAIVDSFGSRRVKQVCGSNVAAWAVRRADDAYSLRAWLAGRPYADRDRIAVMGMSNGGRTVLAALRADLHHPSPFRAGIALYPGCQSDIDARFYAPLLVFSGRADTVTPARFCEAMAANRSDRARIRLVVFPYAPHTFDMDLPDRRHIGMRLGHDPKATAAARRRVIEFLSELGMDRR